MRVKRLLSLAVALALLLCIVPSLVWAEGEDGSITLSLVAPGWSEAYAVLSFGVGSESQAMPMSKVDDRFLCSVPVDAVSLYFNIGSDEVRTEKICSFEDGAIWELTGSYVDTPEGYVLGLRLAQVQITFLVDGEEPYVVSYNKGSSLPEEDLPPVPTKEGYVFVGWALDEDEEEPLDLSQTLFDDNAVLFALWREAGDDPGPGGTVDEVTFAAALSLKENIDINFYIDGVKPEDADRYAVYFSFEDDGSSARSVNLSSLTPLADGRYRIVVGTVYPHEMWRNVVIYVYRDGTSMKGMPITYSASTYLHSAISQHESEPEQRALVDLCKAALIYGSQAQVYFTEKQYTDGNGSQRAYVTNADSLVNDGGYTVQPNRPSEAYEASLSGSVSEVTVDAVSLVLGTETALKVYLSTGRTDVNVSCVDDRGSNHPVSSLKDEPYGRLSFKVTGIRSYELSRIYTVTIADANDNNSRIELTYGPYTYARSYWNEGGIGGLCQTLVAYGDAANAYWGN